MPSAPTDDAKEYSLPRFMDAFDWLLGRRLRRLVFNDPICSGTGVQQRLQIGSSVRCFLLNEPVSAAQQQAPPVVILAHGMQAGSGQMCSVDNVRDAAAFGYALICTQASGGTWEFDQLPSDTAKNACSSKDVQYYESLFGWLADRSDRFDPRRIFLAGFSQGAIITALVAFCRPSVVSGVFQLASSYQPDRLHVVATSPPLRVCTVCDYPADGWCHPMDDVLAAAGHEAHFFQRAGMGHAWPADGAPSQNTRVKPCEAFTTHPHLSSTPPIHTAHSHCPSTRDMTADCAARISESNVHMCRHGSDARVLAHLSDAAAAAAAASAAAAVASAAAAAAAEATAAETTAATDAITATATAAATHVTGHVSHSCPPDLAHHVSIVPSAGAADATAVTISAAERANACTVATECAGHVAAGRPDAAGAVCPGCSGGDRSVLPRVRRVAPRPSHIHLHTQATRCTTRCATRCVASRCVTRRRVTIDDARRQPRMDADQQGKTIVPRERAARESRERGGSRLTVYEVREGAHCRRSPKLSCGFPKLHFCAPIGDFKRFQALYEPPVNIRCGI